MRMRVKCVRGWFALLSGEQQKQIDPHAVLARSASEGSCFPSLALRANAAQEFFILPLAILLLSGSLAEAADKAAVAQVGPTIPAVIVRESAAKPWHIAKDQDSLEVGAQLVGGLGAMIHSANGAVQAKLAGDIGGHSPYPILETSLILQDAKDADFAFELDRGRVDLVNAKKEGSARVKVTIRGKTGEIILKEPGSQLVIEMYSRWPRGVRFTKTPKETDVPALILYLIAVKGEIDLKGKDLSFTLKAPPGPALLVLDGIDDESPQLKTLDAIPAWVNVKDEELIKKIKLSVKQFRDLIDKGSMSAALFQMALSDDETARHTAVILLGALDDLPTLAAAMVASNHDDVADKGIVVLRHWIGRGPGQDLKLYHALIEKGQFKPAEAELALQLLHSFSKADLSKPETYETLLNYLESERPFIRGLANWHLVRVAPAGKAIGFKAIATKEERDKAVKAWHQLIPEGSVPGENK